MNIGDDWLPTAKNINALPNPVRDYIHRLETNCDPSGMVRENILRNDQVKQLETMVAEINDLYDKTKSKEWIWIALTVIMFIMWIT